jgi:PII-like signaling protein
MHAGQITVHCKPASRSYIQMTMLIALSRGKALPNVCRRPKLDATRRVCSFGVTFRSKFWCMTVLRNNQSNIPIDNNTFGTIAGTLWQATVTGCITPKLRPKTYTKTYTKTIRQRLYEYFVEQLTTTVLQGMIVSRIVHLIILNDSSNFGTIASTTREATFTGRFTPKLRPKTYTKTYTKTICQRLYKYFVEHLTNNVLQGMTVLRSVHSNIL